MSKRYLVLSDGTVYEGKAFGAEITENRIGELVFTTGMCGYIETLTDPSYFGQIVLQTFPLIGNYGIIEEDFEGKCCVKGYVVREYCNTPSNFRSQYDIDTFLKQNNIPGIYDLDTRSITRKIRDFGVMNAAICDSIPNNLSDIVNYKIKNAVRNVTGNTTAVYPPKGEKKYTVVLIDYGAKGNILKELNKRGCRVISVPSGTTAEEILSYNPDGLMLSNGPGDPAENAFEIKQLEKLAGKLPVFGICLGHQLFALAMGGKTVKLKYGHRGANQPVKFIKQGRVYITSQNHGYTVIADSLKNAVQSFVNTNDNTNEGLEYPGYKAFTVQFHPEACSGPMDTSFLFDSFISEMGGNNNAVE